MYNLKIDERIHAEVSKQNFRRLYALPLVMLLPSWNRTNNLHDFEQHVYK